MGHGSSTKENQDHSVEESEEVRNSRDDWKEGRDSDGSNVGAMWARACEESRERGQHQH